MTKSEAQQRAFEILTGHPIGQGLDSEDDTRMSEAYDEVYARLQVEKLAIWDSSGAMPPEVETSFLYLMCDLKKDMYSISNERYQRITLVAGKDGEDAIRNIRKMVEPSYENLDPITDF